MNEHALLVIDCQNYFFERSSPAFLPDSRRILPNINLLIGTARDRGWPIIYTVHTAPTTPGNLMAERWEHLPSGRESQIYEKIDFIPGSLIIRKEHFSAFQATGLENYLRNKKITRLVVCGVMTHLCVDTTVRHGFMLGYRSTVISDACGSKDQAYHKAAVLALQHGFATVRSTKQFDNAAIDEDN